MNIEVVQGDSIAYDFGCNELEEFDANWTGLWGIVSRLKSEGDVDVLLAGGSLTRSTDLQQLELRVPPVDTAGIAVGTYYLVAQISNSALSFRQEVMQELLDVVQQGL